MRSVLDTNVVLSGFLWEGAPRQLWTAVLHDELQLFTSEPLIAELQDVLARPKCATRLHAIGLSAEYLLSHYCRMTSLVDPVLIPRLAPDPDDDVVIATALSANANWIVTGDRTLLAVKGYEKIKILSVSEVLQVLGSERTK